MLMVATIRSSSRPHGHGRRRSSRRPGSRGGRARRGDGGARRRGRMDEEELLVTCPVRCCRPPPGSAACLDPDAGTVASDVKAAGGGPTASTSAGVSTNKNRNYAVLVGTITGLSALGWYLLSKDPKKPEEVID